MSNTSSRSNYQMQLWALILGIALMAIKFIAWWFTNSNAVLSDALESIINVVAGAFALYSLGIAAQPRDHNHPYGHGKIEFVSAGFEGALIFLAGISIIGKAIYNLQFPQPIGALDIGVILTVVTGGFNYLMGIYLEKRGRKVESTIMVASGKHLQSDAWSSLGLIIGLGLVWATGWYVLDSVIAILFALLIIYTGYGLVRSAMAGIMDETDTALVAEIVEQLQAHRSPHWIDIHNLRVIKYGAHLHIDCHMTVPWYFTTREAHREVEALERLVNDNRENPVELFIHIDPCMPNSCPLCMKEDCAYRKHVFEKRVEWTMENVVVNERHGV
ncbi:cation diffusion facilitator family transporter [Haliscomenobacter sp.]|uniref:cation diffusion facilitator family transporter n=1 Tax=Haliscomenobacter sp. TaxID=2717303 RepID=UPI0035942F4C